MKTIWVKLKDATKIAWDREQNITITGDKPVEVVKTKFIADKIKEGVLVEVDAPEDDEQQAIDILKHETAAEKKARLKAESEQKAKDEAYLALCDKVSNGLKAFTALTEGELLTQEQIDAATLAKDVISLDGLTDADKENVQYLINGEFQKVLEAQKTLDDAKAAESDTK